MGRVQFILCGSYSADETLNPYALTKSSVHRDILLLLNEKPKSAEEIARILGLLPTEAAEHLGLLARAGLVEKAGATFKPTFALFTLADQKRLAPIVHEFSQAFGKTIAANMELVRKTFEDCGFAEHGFSFTEMAYVLVAAYIADFGGLAFLENNGFLKIKKVMPGGAYIFAGFEGESLAWKHLWMWGHSCTFGRFTFFGHGELPVVGFRRAFPEQAYHWLGKEWPAEKVHQIMDEMGTILSILYEGPVELGGLSKKTGLAEEVLSERLAVLAEMEYVFQREGRWVSGCPVVDELAKALIQTMVETVWERLLEVIKRRWKKLELGCEGTAPARHGIPIQEAFNPIYHWIFGQALRFLLDRGVFSPPKSRRYGARYAVRMECAGG